MVCINRAESYKKRRKRKMQCPHCNAEWNLSNSQSQQIIKNCPFCGESLISEEKPDTGTFGGILRSLVLERGTELYKSEKSQQLKSLLSDMAVNFPKERKTLNIAIMEGIPSKLLSYDGKSDEEKRTALYNNAYFLQEDTGLNKERATLTVNYLATGLGWKVQLEVKKEESMTSETPQSSPPATPQTSKPGEKVYQIGDIGPGGGIVFYHSPSGFNVIQADGSSKLCHYLEVSPTDLGVTSWCSEKEYGKCCCDIQTECGLGYGKINTWRIINGNHQGGLTTKNCAALVCHRYSTGSTKDGEWFLPSESELYLLYKNLGKKVIESNTTGYLVYWSSSQLDDYRAWNQRFSDGRQYVYGKNLTHSVRAVRAF